MAAAGIPPPPASNVTKETIKTIVSRISQISSAFLSDPNYARYHNIIKSNMNILDTLKLNGQNYVQIILDKTSDELKASDTIITDDQIIYFLITDIKTLSERFKKLARYSNQRNFNIMLRTMNMQSLLQEPPLQGPPPQGPPPQLQLGGRRKYKTRRNKKQRKQRKYRRTRKY